MADSRPEDIILYGAMVLKVLLGVPEVGHDTYQQISDRTLALALALARIVLDDEVFDLGQFVGDTLVVVFVFVEQTFVLVFSRLLMV